MESFLGKWKVELEKTTGVEALGKMFGWDDAKIKMYANSGYTLLIEAKGADYLAYLDYTHFQISINFKLGHEVEYTSPDGTTAMVTVTMEGPVMKEAYRTKEGITWNTVRTISGSNMTSETTCPADPSVKCLQYLTKM